MDFYIAWSRSDPLYSKYFPQCNILLSPANSLVSFQLKKWEHPPSRVIVDSSAYYYLSNRLPLPPQKHVFLDQYRIVQDIDYPVYLSHLDHPIGNVDQSSRRIFAFIEKTIGNAYEFLNLYVRYGLDRLRHFEPLGVIQGNDQLTIEYCASELKKMGFQRFGLGSLAPLYSAAEINSRVQIAANIVGGENLHIFGISRLDILETLAEQKIGSLDSSRPMKAAIYQAVFYSEPFRTYGIYSSNNSSVYSKVLREPLPCSCPICQENPLLILGTGTQKSYHARALHNYYHLLKHLIREEEQ